MTRLGLLAFLGLVVLGRLVAPVDALAEGNQTRTRGTTGQMGIGTGAEAVDKPNGHMTKNLRATRNAQRNLRATPEARVQSGPMPKKATTRRPPPDRLER